MTLDVERDGVVARVRAELAVIADGRHSPLRNALGIEMTEERSAMLTCGALLEGVRCDDSDAIGMFMAPQFDAMALLIPLPRDRVRLYFVERRSERRRYSGAADLAVLLERCLATGVPPAWLADARAVGPLATFDTTCCQQANHDLPARIVLAGDAAGNVDPVFGCGLSLALRDARHFADQLRVASGDLQLAAARFTTERRVCHRALLRVEAWLMRILFTPSPEGDALRGATMPRLAALGIDLVGLGPDSATDGATEAALFADAPRAASLEHAPQSV